MSPMSAMSAQDRGHRLAPHTSDSIIEAWGPDRLSCFEEAMEALVEIFVNPTDTTVLRSVPVSVDSGPDTDVLVSLLQEEIYLIDVFGVVPVCFHLAGSEDGGISGQMDVMEASEAELTGPVPKGVSYHGLEVQQHDGKWRCRAVVDV